MSTRAKCVLTVLAGLIVILAGVRCVADTNAVTRGDWYFKYRVNETNEGLCLVQFYASPGVQVIVTPTNNLATIIIRNGLLWSNEFAQLTYWGARDPQQAVEMAEYIPFVPPPLTPEQRLYVSNVIWKRLHPVTIASPKKGAGNVIKLPAKGPRP